jgi:FixJ family two-component response regulator
VHIVDDDESFRTSMTRLLRAAGYVTRAYGSGPEFLEHFEPGPGCLILDVHMPGMTGLDLYQALSTRPDVPPVIFISGQVDPSTFDPASYTGAVDFLGKPVDAHRLLETIERALRLGATRRTLAAATASDNVQTIG